MKPMPIGVKNFREIIEGGYAYADKTLFIKELLDNRAKVTLITRPRRFGKSLNMSMVKAFFDISEDNHDIFKGLNIEAAGESYMAKMGAYPVISISMAFLERETMEKCRSSIAEYMAFLYQKYDFLAASLQLTDTEREEYTLLCNAGQMENKLETSLNRLTYLLHKHYGAKPVVLIDEYDAPIQHAWSHGFADDMLSLTRSLYGTVLKDNDDMAFALVTGVLRVAKESIFSGLNNLQVCGVSSPLYREAFGFTEADVKCLAIEQGAEDKLPEIKAWYDGYSFAGAEIYNPWSVLSYFAEKCMPIAYWGNTSANAILQELLKQMTDADARELQILMAGGVIKKRLRDSIIYHDIGNNKDDLYSILLATGYLKARQNPGYPSDRRMLLAIPNYEIHQLYEDQILLRFAANTGISNADEMLDAMAEGNVELFRTRLAQILAGNVSCYDTANRESFYHGLMLGFCILLAKSYDVESNKESGYGRFDIAMTPKEKNHAGVILEFKCADREDMLAKKAAEALAQIEERQYAADMQAKGVQTIWKYGVAFCGKNMAITLNE